MEINKGFIINVNNNKSSKGMIVNCAHNSISTILSKKDEEKYILSKLYTLIDKDNKETSYFVKAILKGKKLDWESFLEEPIEKISDGLKEKYINELLFDFEKQYIDLTELNSSERRFILAIHCLECAINFEKDENAANMIKYLKDKDYFINVCTYSPVSSYMCDIIYHNLSLKDSLDFFNYETLIKFNTALYILYSLYNNNAVMDASLEVIAADLKHYVDYFIIYDLYDEDMILFTLFKNLIDKFSDFIHENEY